MAQVVADNKQLQIRYRYVRLYIIAFVYNAKNNNKTKETY